MMEDDARVMTRMLREQGVDELAQRSHSRKRGVPASAEEAGAKRAAPAVAVMTNKEVQAQQMRARELADMALSNIQALASAAHTFGAAAQAALWLDERAAGEPVSLSSRTLQLQLPTHGRTPGRHVWSGDPEAGFAPAEGSRPPHHAAVKLGEAASFPPTRITAFGAAPQGAAGPTRQ